MHVNPAEYRNNFVRVHVISQSASINCTFLNVLKEAEKSCNAKIISGETCQDKTMINGMKDGDNVVIINVRSVLEDTIYCSFIVNATANARTVIVEGNLLGISYKGIPVHINNFTNLIFQQYLSLRPAVTVP